MPKIKTLTSKNNFVVYGEGKYLHFSNTLKCFVLDKKKPTGKKHSKLSLVEFIGTKNQFEYISDTILPKSYLEAFKVHCSVRGEKVHYI